MADTEHSAADELAAAVSPTFASAGSAWYFTEATRAAGKALGLDGMRFYVLGRGGVLGEVDWRIVWSAFGYFSPALIERLWTTGAERCPVERARQAHLEACEAWGREQLADVAGLPAFCEAADRVVTAAAGDLGGLTLFAGYAAQPLPDDLPARAARLVAALREHRGSAHLAAVAAVGLATPVAHAMRRPGMVEGFGWEAGSLPEATDDDRRLLAEADRLTDRATARPYRALDAAGADALRAGADGIAAALAG
ncbi:MAG TPA: hypothetical protein VFP61_09200 [Acidimicrobiales bacterium]|nr:hypothetical protein [Acidimicrobiales bacterium]